MAALRRAASRAVTVAEKRADSGLRNPRSSVHLEKLDKLDVQRIGLEMAAPAAQALGSRVG